MNLMFLAFGYGDKKSNVIILAKLYLFAGIISGRIIKGRFVSRPSSFSFSFYINTTLPQSPPSHPSSRPRGSRPGGPGR
jgi:hypothetical protein